MLAYPECSTKKIHSSSNQHPFFLPSYYMGLFLLSLHPLKIMLVTFSFQPVRYKTVPH